MVYHSMIWIAIGICITQSAMFSGLNLAVFGISRLRLEAEASSGDRSAKKVLKLRKNSNYTLTTILWGNVAINVLLTLLSRSVLAGIAAFLFSTVVITFIGEIIPQAYFSRNALRMASLLSPLLRFYMFLLYPVVKPTSVMLNLWLGTEGISYFKERDLQEVIKKHMQNDESEISGVEGRGALNFLALDDIPVNRAGDDIEPESVLQLTDTQSGLPLDEIVSTIHSSYIDKLRHCKAKYIVLVKPDGKPFLVIDADAFIHLITTETIPQNLCRFLHKPVVITDPTLQLASILPRLKMEPAGNTSIVPNQDVIILWSSQRRIITDQHILAQLLAGIAITS